MTNLEEVYDRYCANLNVPNDGKIRRALIDVCTYGELNIAGLSVTSHMCDVLSKILNQSKDINKLNLSDCLLPPQGLAQLLSVMHLTNVHTLQLRGNNIAGPSVFKLSKMVSRSFNIKNLGLEWNNLGLCSEGMTHFCNALSANHGLEVLDLRNNQLDERCAALLAEALSKNTVLRALDIQWNSMEQTGGQYLLAALHTNKTLTAIKLQGNSISNDLLTAIEQCVQHNSNLLRLESGYQARKEVLTKHIQTISNQRAQDLRDWADKNQQQINEMDSKVMEMHQLLVNKQKEMENLKTIISDKTQTLEAAQNQVKSLEEEQKLREVGYAAAVRDYQLQLDTLNKALAMNKTNLSSLQEKLDEERELRAAMGKDRLRDKEKIRELEQEINKRKEELQRTITEHIDEIEQERKQSQQRLTLVVEEWTGRLEQTTGEHTRAEQVYRDRLRTLEALLEAAEQSRVEQNTQWAAERTKWAEEKANIWAEAKEKETCKLLLLTEKVDHLKEEKFSLDSLLSVANTSAQQLQRDNSNILADLSELRRKLSIVQEELSNERLTTQKLRSEKLEDVRMLDSVRSELENSQKAVTKASYKQDELRQEIRRLSDQLEEKQRYILIIRKEEKDRAGLLVAAIKTYVDQVNSTNS